MFGSRQLKDEICRKLHEVDSELAVLPNQTEENLKAQEIIERLKAKGVSIDEINAELASNGLPTVAEVGKATADSMIATWKLNRKRRQLEKQLAKFD